MRGCLGINYKNKFKLQEYSIKPHEFLANSDHGKLKVWADNNGIYIDIFDSMLGDICIASIHPENYGYSCFVYEDYKKGMPTRGVEFRNVDVAFDDYIGDKVM